MPKSFPETRMRRNRLHPLIRDAVAESHLQKKDLIYPIFVAESGGPIEGFPDQSRIALANINREIDRYLNLGIQKFALFPATTESMKSKNAEYAYRSDGLMQQALGSLKKTFANDICLIADVALDPYTVNGQDGLTNSEGLVINDMTLPILVKQAISLAEAGADILAPSDMMDGRVGEIRRALEKIPDLKERTVILSYAAKYASTLYGPFRAAVGSEKNLASSDKKTYQMDFRNKREALEEARLDLNEGADILMVKPAIPYLDVVHLLSTELPAPLWAYHVSGEYCMAKAAAAKGFIKNLDLFWLEYLSCIKRAGAKCILTYAAPEVVQRLN